MEAFVECPRCVERAEKNIQFQTCVFCRGTNRIDESKAAEYILRRGECSDELQRIRLAKFIRDHVSYEFNDYGQLCEYDSE